MNIYAKKQDLYPNPGGVTLVVDYLKGDGCFKSSVKVDITDLKDTAAIDAAIVDAILIAVDKHDIKEEVNKVWTKVVFDTSNVVFV